VFIDGRRQPTRQTRKKNCSREKRWQLDRYVNVLATRKRGDGATGHQRQLLIICCPEKLPYVAVRVRSVSFFIQVNRHSLYKRLVLRAGCVFYPAIVLFFCHNKWVEINCCFIMTVS
jgi:hypothetical protein